MSEGVVMCGEILIVSDSTDIVLAEGFVLFVREL